MFDHQFYSSNIIVKAIFRLTNGSDKSFCRKFFSILPADWSTAWREHIHGNYLRVNILRETNVVEVNTQSASLDFIDVLSNVGGQTGLWIGISFLSIMELIEMIYRLIRYQVHSVLTTV